MNFEEIIKFIGDSPMTSSIYIGCDSKRHKRRGKWIGTYSRVVVIHIESSKGCKIFGDIVVQPDYGSLRQRLMQEVHYAIEIAEEIVPHVGDRPFEIHLDVNPDEYAGSSVVIKEALGYVRGTIGVEAKVKPEAIASSYAADMMCRKELGDRVPTIQ